MTNTVTYKTAQSLTSTWRSTCACVKLIVKFQRQCSVIL